MSYNIWNVDIIGNDVVNDVKDIANVPINDCMLLVFRLKREKPTQNSKTQKPKVMI